MPPGCNIPFPRQPRDQQPRLRQSGRRRATPSPHRSSCALCVGTVPRAARRTSGDGARVLQAHALSPGLRRPREGRVWLQGLGARCIAQLPRDFRPSSHSALSGRGVVEDVGNARTAGAGGSPRRRCSSCEAWNLLPASERGSPACCIGSTLVTEHGLCQARVGSGLPRGMEMTRGLHGLHLLGGRWAGRLSGEQAH